MERVQFQEEQMLPELKAFQEEGVFTKKEIKAILVQRRRYETSLVRRVSRKSDYLQYIEYERSLEKLRKARVQRLHIETGKNNVIEYALVRRQFALFERALKRPKIAADVGIWVQYIQLAQKEGARTLVGRVTARALSLHPRNPSLYILSSSHALESQQSPSAARALLQRGLRLNKDSIELWKAYVGMELGFVVITARRWGVLGIADEKGKGKEKQLDLDGGDTVMEDAAEEEDMSAEARKEILNGAIVKSVISAAVEALPKPTLLCELLLLVKDYPAPKDLRDSLLDHIYSHMEGLDAAKFTSDDQALVLKLLAARHFSSAGLVSPSLDQVLDLNALSLLTPRELLDSVTRAVETLQGGLKASGTDHRCAHVYVQFLLLLCAQSHISQPLKQYLVKGLRIYIQEESQGTTGPGTTGLGILMAAHVQLLSVLQEESEALKACRRYCRNDFFKDSQTSLSAEGRCAVWLARLNRELNISSREDVKSIWKEARSSVGVSGEVDSIANIWTWGLDGSEKLEDLEDLICESQLISSRATHPNVVHPVLLSRYWRRAIDTGVVDVGFVQKRFKLKWGIDGKVWRELFAIASNADLHMDVVKEVYEGWRGVASADGHSLVDCVVSYAKYLVNKDKTLEAAVVIRDGMARAGATSEKVELEQAWTRLLEQSGEHEREQVAIAPEAPIIEEAQMEEADVDQTIEIAL